MYGMASNVLRFQEALFQEGIWACVLSCLSDQDIAQLEVVSKQCNQLTKTEKIFVAKIYEIPKLEKESRSFRRAITALPFNPLATDQEENLWRAQIQKKMVEEANEVCRFLSESARIGLQIPKSAAFPHCSLRYLHQIITSVQRLPINEVTFNDSR